MTDFLQRRRSEFERVSTWGTDVLDRLLPFVTGGKMLRGALVQLAASDEAANAHPEAIKPAAAMELVQAFLLIHDDIMDRDDTRRGHRALYAQYEDLGRSRGMGGAAHYGVSMGMCGGDIATFLATELLADTNVDRSTLADLMRRFSREIAHVGLAQMSDLTNGALPGEGLGLEEIERVYRYKTGRYTFSLPLMLGALVRGTTESELAALSEYGELAGIAFQVKDDELGLFAHADTLGKPVGSDISENKKTLHRHFLFEAALPDERERLAEIFGADALSERDLGYVRDLLHRYAVAERVEREMNGYREGAKRCIANAHALSSYAAAALLELLDFNARRNL